jgi:hypothetical protein
MSGPTLYRLPVVRGNTAAGIYLGAIGTAVGIVLLSIWVTTQLTAYRLHFHPALGSPLLVLRSPYRELLGPAAVLTTLGVGGLMIPACSLLIARARPAELWGETVIERHLAEDRILDDDLSFARDDDDLGIVPDRDERDAAERLERVQQPSDQRLLPFIGTRTTWTTRLHLSRLAKK